MDDLSKLVAQRLPQIVLGRAGGHPLHVDCAPVRPIKTRQVMLAVVSFPLVFANVSLELAHFCEQLERALPLPAYLALFDRVDEPVPLIASTSWSAASTVYRRPTSWSAFSLCCLVLFPISLRLAFVLFPNSLRLPFQSLGFKLYLALLLLCLALGGFFLLCRWQLGDQASGTLAAPRQSNRRHARAPRARGTSRWQPLPSWSRERLFERLRERSSRWRPLSSLSQERLRELLRERPRERSSRQRPRSSPSEERLRELRS